MIALILCPNDRTHRTLVDQEVTMEHFGDVVPVSRMLMPECAECGAQMELRHFRTQEDVVLGRAMEDEPKESR